MPSIEYTSSNWPDREEFRRAVREAIESYDPVEELLELHSELGEYERKYGLASEECYRRFTAGQMGDDLDIFGWVGSYKAFVRLKADIKQSLDVIVNDPFLTMP
jgi:hypothetical protein